MSALEIEQTRFTPEAKSRNDGDLAVMLTGGGARAAYQVGLIKGIARHFPDLHFQIITGVSAGAINAVFLASKRGNLEDKAISLERLWCELTCSSIYHFDWRVLVPFRSALVALPVAQVVAPAGTGRYDSPPPPALPPFRVWSGAGDPGH